MKNLLIIGARGFGRVIYHLAIKCKDYDKEFRIKGFLDDKYDALDNYPGYPQIIESVEDYRVKSDDVFICALGELNFKKKYTQIIIDKGGNFISLVHPSVSICKNTKIGKGCIIFRNVGMACDVSIGDFVTLHSLCIISHDVKIGNWSQVNSFSFIGGTVELADEVTIHPGAIIHPNKKIARGSTVGAGSFVIRDVEENTTVIGSPAVKLK
jgi:sugar O-acyltransferase (sialic acid O-acetyltransferase NeuD family)